jgi:hypothetical protein
MSPEDSNMSTISTAICRSLLLWWHLGIEPLIGAGPMQPHRCLPKTASQKALSNGDR